MSEADLLKKEAEDTLRQIDASFRDPLAKMFAQEAVQETRRKRIAKKAAPELGDLIANKFFAMCLDNSIRKSSGLPGLSYFLPSSPPKALAEHERRFYITLPEDMVIEGSSPNRSCILDTRDQSTRIEVPRETLDDGTLSRPCLHRCFDQGSVGLACSQWLDLQMLIRGTSTEDP